MINLSTNENDKQNLKLKVNLRNIIVYILIIYTIMFPRDMINVKEIILFATFVLCLPSLISIFKENNKENNFLIFFSLIYSSVTILISAIIGESSFFSAFTYGYVWVFLLLLPIIKKYNIDIKKPFFVATTLIAVMTDFIYLADFFNVISIFKNPLVLFFNKLDELHYGKGIMATYGYSIFFKACSLMIFTYAYALKNKKWLWSGILFFALLASGTRANMIAALCVTLLVVMNFSQKTAKKMVIIFFVLLISLLLLPKISTRLSNLNKLKSTRGDSIKEASAHTIINYLNEYPMRYVFGTGLGSSFYFPARGQYVSVIELSYLDYFRQVGAVGFIFFIYFLIKPIYKLYKKEEKWLLYAYIMYLAIAFTNPLLFSSTAFMGYILVYDYYFRKENIKTEENL